MKDAVCVSISSLDGVEQRKPHYALSLILLGVSFVFQKGRFHKFPKPPTAINKGVDYFLSGKSVSLCVGVCLSVCECVGVCECV